MTTQQTNFKSLSLQTRNEITLKVLEVIKHWISVSPSELPDYVRTSYENSDIRSGYGQHATGCVQILEDAGLVRRYTNRRGNVMLTIAEF